MAERKRWRTTGKTAIKKSRYSKVKEDNRKIRDGERRKGPNGKMNIYNAKTKRWVRAKKSDTLSDGSKEKNCGERSNTSGTVSSAKSAAKSAAKSLPRNVGLGGSAPPFRPPSRKPAQEKVANVKPGDKRIRHGLQPTFLNPKTSKKTPIGRVVMRGNPPKKYIWNGERFERYTGPRPPSPKR